jgi:hypothetical protein
MIYGGIIKRLREQAPMFERRVGGTAQFESLSKEDSVDLKMPYGFVVPLYETAEPRANMADNQRVTEKFAIIVAVDNSTERKDGLGLIAMDLMMVIRQELFDAMLPWEPLPYYDTIQYVGSRHLTMSRVRLWRQFEWSVSYPVTAKVGVHHCVKLQETYAREGITGFPPPPGYEGFEGVYPASIDGLPYKPE